MLRQVMSQIINDNVGNEDSYTMITNHFNPKNDPLGQIPVPSFVTAQTYPPLPGDEHFKCSSLAANAEDLARACFLINIDTWDEVNEEENRLDAMIGKRIIVGR